MYFVPSYYVLFSKSNCFNHNCSNEQDLDQEQTAAWVGTIAYSGHASILSGIARNLNFVLNLLLSCTPHALSSAWGVVNDI